MYINTNLPVVFPGQRCVGSGSHCPAVLSSVCSAALWPSAAELWPPAAAERVGLWRRPGPRLVEPDGKTEGRVRGRGGGGGARGNAAVAVYI